MKIIIYFVNAEKIMQKQRVLNFDHKDQQSTIDGQSYLLVHGEFAVNMLTWDNWTCSLK